MKTNTYAAVALISLIAIGGNALAADTSHDPYYQAFYGTVRAPATDAIGKAAHATPSGDTAPWSGHQTYNGAFLGISTSDKSPVRGQMGRAASDSTSSIDGLAAYHNAFRGD